MGEMQACRKWAGPDYVAQGLLLTFLRAQVPAALELLVRPFNV